MIEGFDNRLWKLVATDKASRKYIFADPKGFPYFCVWNWPAFFRYRIPEFQWGMYDDAVRLNQSELAYVVWMMFRESAKTTIAKWHAVWNSVNKFKRYINFDSIEKENAENALFDIAVWFQTNKRLITDYGQLYFERQKEASTMKRVGAFVLGNGVKFEAFSTQESTRGRLYQDARPDAYYMDDIESVKTKRSVARTREVIDHLDELFGGLAPTASVVFCCNYISDSGVVQYVLDKAKNNPRFSVRRVDAEVGGEPTWGDKYAKTDLEAAARNVERPLDAPIVSLEAKRRDLGDSVYESEMMNNPAASINLVFDRAKLKAMKPTPPLANHAGFKVWTPFNPAHRYAIGADTAKGVGRDSSASVAIDFTVFPNQQVGSYRNNLIPPDTFAHELKRQGDIFGGCLLAPEVNNQGYATITELKRIYRIGRIYHRVQRGKSVKEEDRPMYDLGWDTNAATKPDMLYQLKSAVENGHLAVNDENLLEEMMRYNQDDLSDLTNDPERITRHFDLLIACAIAWAMRQYAVLTEPPGVDHREEVKAETFDPYTQR